MKLRILLSAVLLSSLVLNAQDDKNLVKNPSFEAINGKLKKPKQLELATNWTSPTAEKADLYSRSVKELPVSAPENTNGKETPADGNNYAGVMMYSFGDKAPRTYIMTELLGPLKAGVKYCVRFDVSLSDNSKYAVNNIGAHVSKKPFGFEDKRSIMAETHVKNSKNKIYNNTYGWETVCAVFTASGGEKYLTLGNFSPTKDTKNEKVTKPKDSKAQQLPFAYYYIDKVSVFQLDSIEECQCEAKEKIEEATVIVGEGYTSNKEFKLKEKIAHEKVFFTHLSTDINQIGLESINVLVDLMNNNPDAVIEVHAHSESSEVAAATKVDTAKDLAKRRGEAVVKQLEKAGISTNRIVLVIDDDKDPVSKGESESEKARNRRVTFQLRE